MALQLLTGKVPSGFPLSNSLNPLHLHHRPPHPLRQTRSPPNLSVAVYISRTSLLNPQIPSEDHQAHFELFVSQPPSLLQTSLP